jgi:hypothetical protein
MAIYLVTAAVKEILVEANVFVQEQEHGYGKPATPF